MKIYFPQVASAIMLIVLGLINLFWIWALHRQWWRFKSIRRAMWLLPLIGLLADGVWALCAAVGWSTGTRILSYPAIIFFLASVALAVSLPLSGIILLLERGVRSIITKRRAQPVDPSVHEITPSEQSLPVEVEIDKGRRSFVTSAAAVIPAFAIGTSVGGLLDSSSPVVMPNIEMFFSDLPRELEGLRILHISDIHIGYYIDLHDLERTLLAAEQQRADLVLVTGDIADQLTELPEALRMINGLKPRYGTLASLGNHEYYAGIGTVLKSFDAGPIPLLRNSGTIVPIGAAQLYIGGADDPVMIGDRPAKERFLLKSIDSAFDTAPSTAFHLLMSHRPEGLDIAAERGIQMTISGHTHAGGQIGWNGRSFIEQLGLGRYMWGYYQKNGSQLYTSAGTGHWFPFRLGVPREAPVYILRRKI